MRRKMHGEFMLIITALIWGVSFVAQRAGMEYIGPFTFNGIRCLIGALVLLPVLTSMAHQRKKRQSAETEIKATEIELKTARKDLIAGGLVCGVVFFISSSLQQIGMIYTTAGKAGFITALYIVIVPILGIFLRQKVRPILWLCVVLATTGLYLLCIQEDFLIGKGDLLILICAFGFSIHILVIDHFSPKIDGVKLSCFQFLVCGILSIPCMIIFETIRWADIINCWLPILYAGVLSCGIAYTLQVVAQKYTEPTVTSLILSMESVFAVIAGIIILNEQISIRETFGCIIMFIAILLAQIPSKGKITNKLSEKHEEILNPYKYKGEDVR
ncbi:DMT family transporter [Clostridium aminobutyricum]|uniref:DMT family transporter n=1 Tax=Clostridium aminobutyricum TaxID=33953 RepID=A0A939D6C6_CLOAM|nr:DMT family transporter [Clostridium aminobutyricum]MBN7772344.1 DMT family transporter [Clostridium aminobutyricum]